MRDQKKKTTDLPFISNKVKAVTSSSPISVVVMWLIVSQFDKFGFEASPETLAAIQVIVTALGVAFTTAITGYLVPQQPLPEQAADKTKTEQANL